MAFYVYMLKCINYGVKKSYVGYTNNIPLRLQKHNSNRGAKFTKGKFWKIIYFEKYSNKVDAMKNEYKLKKNYKLRSKIKLSFFI